MSIHDGHRQRVKDRFRKDGLDNFNELHALELLLFYCIPQGDTNPLAHELIDRFGSLPQVLEAPAHELEKVKGIGAHASTLLNLTAQITRFYNVNRDDRKMILSTTTLCGNYLKSHFIGRRDETVFLLCLDAKCKLLSCNLVGEGSVNSAGLSIRKIVETALGMNATSVVLAHNHPSGIAVPSAEDITTTRRVAMALDAVGITLADHIVVAGNDFVSLLQSNYYRPEDCRVPL